MFFLLLLILFILNSFSLNYFDVQTISEKEKISSHKKPKRPKIAPPGTVKLNDTLYIQPAPVTNLEYKRFLNFLKFSYSKKVRDSLDNLPLYGVHYENFQRFMQLYGYDTLLLEKMQIRLDIPLAWGMDMATYFNNEMFKTYPVVYVSYEQAVTYCKWLTHMTLYLYAHTSKNKRQRSKYYTKINYRLPTPEEWDLVFKTFGDAIIHNKSIFPRSPAFTYPTIQPRRKLIFYYIPGNVAEMTSEEEVAIGISWNDPDTTNNYNKRVQYTRRSDWLGFRCICEILEY